jgi:hypothetical protein
MDVRVTVLHPVGEGSAGKVIGLGPRSPFEEREYGKQSPLLAPLKNKKKIGLRLFAANNNLESARC